MIKPFPKPQPIIPRKRQSVRRRAVTVCVAAIAEKSTVIGASDRMLTAGDVEFEPGQAKMWAFSTSAWALVSGDAAIQGDILKDVGKEVQEWIVADPKAWVSVKSIATLYCKKYREALRASAEAAILHPTGLDIATFLATQTTLQPEFVSDLAEKLTAY